MEGTRKASGKGEIEDKRQNGANKVIACINPFCFVLFCFDCEFCDDILTKFSIKRKKRYSTGGTGMENKFMRSYAW
jgi:hypothetical protein